MTSRFLNVFFLKSPKVTDLKYKIIFRIVELKKWLWIRKQIKKINPHLVIVSSYEPVTFSIISHLFRVPVIAFNHNNLDELSKNKVKAFFFKLMSKKVIHVVFEDYMKHYLKEKLKLRHKIWVLPHIAFRRAADEEALSGSKDSTRVIFFAPSGSNDKNMIENLAKCEQALLKKSVFIVAKFPICYSGENIILKNYFTDDEYEQYMKISTAIFVPLEKNFNYRASNVINEGIAYGKQIITTCTKYTSFLRENYPSLVYVVKRGLLDEIEDIVKWLEETKESFLKDRERFLKEHSEERFNELFREYVDAVLRELEKL